MKPQGTLKSFFHFVAYNNFFVIIVAIIFVATGTTFAANPEMVISHDERVVSIDNTLILGLDMEDFDPEPQIEDVSEDEENYYVVYSMTNVAIVDYAWKDVTETRTLKVAKAALRGEDLGLRVAREIGQVADGVIAYLTEVQELEIKKGRSDKVASVTYSGLVGRFLDTEKKVFPSYKPVVKELNVKNPQAKAAVASDDDGDQSAHVSELQIQIIVRNAIDEYFRVRDTATSTPSDDLDDDDDNNDNDDDNDDDNTNPDQTATTTDPTLPSDDTKDDDTKKDDEVVKDADDEIRNDDTPRGDDPEPQPPEPSDPDPEPEPNPDPAPTSNP